MELGVIMFLSVIGALYLFTFCFVKYYQDKDESMEFLPVFVTMTTLTVCLLSVLLLPFDVFMVSIDGIDKQTADAYHDTMKTIYVCE